MDAANEQEVEEQQKDDGMESEQTDICQPKRLLLSRRLRKR